MVTVLTHDLQPAPQPRSRAMSRCSTPSRCSLLDMPNLAATCAGSRRRRAAGLGRSHAPAEGHVRLRRLQEPPDAPVESLRSDLAFPHRQHPPAQSPQTAPVPGVALDVPIQLRFPVSAIGPRPPVASSTSVLMPEAAVHEDDRPVSGQHEIRRSGKVSPVEPEPVAQSVDQPPYGDLGRGVGRSYLRHHGAAFRGREPFRQICSASSSPPIAASFRRIASSSCGARGVRLSPTAGQR